MILFINRNLFKMATSLQFQQNGPESFQYNGFNVYLADDLRIFKPEFFTGIRSLKNIIEKQNIPTDQYFIVKYINKNYSECDPKYLRCKILIKSAWTHKHIFNYEPEKKYRELHDILELKEEEKFKDDDGNIYEVEVRGTRNKDEIRFKAKDVAEVFMMKNLVRYIQDQDSGYIVTEDYEILFVMDTGLLYPLQIEKIQNPHLVKRLFLTYRGLIKVICNSRSGVAYKFLDWMINILFTAHLGSDEDKLQLANELAGINPEIIKTIFSKCIAQMSCICIKICIKIA